AAEELQTDDGAAAIALEHAWMTDPTRLDTAHRLELELLASGREADLLRVLERDPSPDRPTLVDTALLASLAGRDDAAVAGLYHQVLKLEPLDRFAQIQLETNLRRSGANDQLAALYDDLAARCDRPHDE